MTSMGFSGYRKKQDNLFKKVQVEYLVVLYLGIRNESSRMNGYVIIMRVFRNCPYCRVSRVIRKLKLIFFLLCQKVAAVSNYLPNYF